jgi:hypothetical protein
MAVMDACNLVKILDKYAELLYCECTYGSINLRGSMKILMSKAFMRHCLACFHKLHKSLYVHIHKSFKFDELYDLILSFLIRVDVGMLELLSKIMITK